MALKQALIIFTKEPVEKKVKTRLAKSIGDKEALKIYELLLQNLLNLSINKNIDTFIALEAYTNNYKKRFENQNIFLQEGKNIGEKMSNSFIEVFKKGYEQIILVGADIPFFDEEFIHNSFSFLNKHDAIITKTKDDGYCLIGFKKEFFIKEAFEIDFSNDVYKKTIETLKHLNIKKTETLFDIDTINDLREFTKQKNIKTNQKFYDYSKKLFKSFPKISVIIPVYFEKENLPKTIEVLKNNSYYNDFEIIISDTLQRTTIDDINIQDIRTTISQKAGRSFQLNEGAKCAKGEILLFLHADTLVSKNWDKDIYELYLKDKNLSGAFSLKIDTNNIFIKIIEFFANFRVKLTNTPYGDQGQFFSHELFYKIGTYDEIPLMEDISIIKKVHKKNIKTKVLDKKIHTSDRRWQKEGIFYTTFRNRILSTLYYFGVSSKVLKKYYKF